MDSMPHPHDDVTIDHVLVQLVAKSGLASPSCSLLLPLKRAAFSDPDIPSYIVLENLRRGCLDVVPREQLESAPEVFIFGGTTVCHIHRVKFSVVS